MRVGNDRIRKVFQIGILTQHDVLGLSRIVGIHRMDFRGGLRRDVRTRIGRQVNFNVEPVALQDAAGGCDNKDARQVGQRFVPVQRLLYQKWGTTIQMRKHGALPAAFKTETQEGVLPHHTAGQLARLILKESKLLRLMKSGHACVVVEVSCRTAHSAG